MQTEDRVIPYRATDLTGRRVLVLAPHPDDETIGCGGSLALHTGAGDPVKVVFLTNGARGDMAGAYSREAYVALRREEAQEACRVLGVTDLEFWAQEDRALAESREGLRRLVRLLAEYRPGLLYAPSPLEFHPDHRAACYLLQEAVRAYDCDFEVAFSEAGQPLRINTLVDISSVLDLKKAACEAYRSQLKERPYTDICIALNRYRSLTLPEGTTHAEGFVVWNTALLKKAGLLTLPFQKAARLAPSRREAGPLVSVIMRTKDRPNLLAHAVNSVARQTYRNVELVLVNEGTQDVSDLAAALAPDLPLVYCRHAEPRGRAAAANTGLNAANGAYLNFLDDDDILYPDHVETLISFLRARGEKVAYSSVLNVYFTGPPEIPDSRGREELIFNIPFDADRLIFENYIPLMSVLFSRDVLSHVEGFCEELVLFEDWDFWRRVARRYPFHHVDKVTAEYRFFGEPSMEAAHRRAYRYDEALAVMFDRARSYMSGRAWARFVQGGMLGNMRQEIWAARAARDAAEAAAAQHASALEDLQRDLARSQERCAAAEEAAAALSERCRDLEQEREGLLQSQAQYERILARIRRHPGYRAYRWVRRFTSPQGES